MKFNLNKKYKENCRSNSNQEFKGKIEPCCLGIETVGKKTVAYFFNADGSKEIANPLIINSIEMGQNVMILKGIQTDEVRYWYQEMYLLEREEASDG